MNYIIGNLGNHRVKQLPYVWLFNFMYKLKVYAVNFPSCDRYAGDIERFNSTLSDTFQCCMILYDTYELGQMMSYEALALHVGSQSVGWLGHTQGR